jgi:enamine deaminase RidA (YjgF/YER057c/UK114 family)
MRLETVQLTRAGDFLFSNVIWVLSDDADLALVMTGKGHIDARDGRAKAQTAGIYRALADALSEHGLNLENIVHQRVRFRDMDQYGVWFRSAFELLDVSSVATSIHSEGVGMPPGVEVSLEVIVSADANARISIVAPPETLASTNPFPPAVRVGQFIFTSALNPTTPDGEIVTRFRQLETHSGVASFPEFAGQGSHGWRDELHGSQMLAIYEHVDRIFGSVGSSAESLLKHNGHVRMPMDAYTAMEAARRMYFGERKAPPATTVQVAGLGLSDEVKLTFDLIGLAHGPLRRQEIDLSSLTAPYGYYLGAVRAGKLLFTAGELPYVRTIGTDPRGGVTGSWDGDLDVSLAPQTRDVVRRLRSILELAGPGLPGLRRLGLSLKDRRHLEPWLRVGLAELPGALPVVAETVVLDAGPYRTCVFELDSVSEFA